jgi:beta-lactamase superfamily II metal-dependent hydrolase
LFCGNPGRKKQESMMTSESKMTSRLFCVVLLAVIYVNGVQPGRPSDDLHLFAFPVGQGEAQVVQCPDGQLTVVDMGSWDGKNQGFFHVTQLREFFKGRYDRIRNVVITHNHLDHFNLIPDVLKRSDGMRNLKNIYISETIATLPDPIRKWINDTNSINKVRVFNGGDQCGPNKVPCGNIDLCPRNGGIVAKVLSVNAGKTCPGPPGENDNVNSIVFSIKFDRVKVQLNGDFEDCSPTKEGPQKELVDFYGKELETTVYKLAHHGASKLANKAVTRNAVKPKAIFVSGSPYSKYHHPRCEIINAFIQDVGTLCEPAIPNSSKYCGPHPVAKRSTTIVQKVRMKRTTHAVV